VRLKVTNAHRTNIVSNISIPFGAIKSTAETLEKIYNVAFQFLLVRLKVQFFSCNQFQIFPISIPFGAIKSHALLFSKS